MSCYRFDGDRYVRDLHLEGCPITDCSGCVPCPERHCQVDRCHEHVTADGRGADLTCSNCLSLTRTRIIEIVRMSTLLVGEAIIRGLNSQAFALAGPAADPEAWGHVRMSALANRIDPTWLDDQIDMLHPSWVLGTWAKETRLHLHLDEVDNPTLTEASSLLLDHLSNLAQDQGFAFDEMADEVKTCHDHIESVLHLDNSPVTGVRCWICANAYLVKEYDTEVNMPVLWRCPRCTAWWSDATYRHRVEGAYIEHAKALTAPQLNEQYDIPVGSVRQWAARGDVRRRGKDSHGHVVYDVEQARAANNARLARLAAKAARSGGGDTPAADGGSLDHTG